LDRDAQRNPIADSETGRHLAAGAEARVKAAVVVVAGEREVPDKLARETGASNSDDLAVVLNGDIESEIVAGSEVGRHPAPTAEARVETAVEVVAGEREVRDVAGNPRVSCGDDLPVGLEGDTLSGVTEAEVRDDRPAYTEACVEVAVRLVAGKREVARRTGAPGGDDPAIRLNREVCSPARASAEVGGDSTAYAETWIEVARSGTSRRANAGENDDEDDCRKERHATHGPTTRLSPAKVLQRQDNRHLRSSFHQNSAIGPPGRNRQPRLCLWAVRPTGAPGQARRSTSARPTIPMRRNCARRQGLSFSQMGGSSRHGDKGRARRFAGPDYDWQPG
jgi:hypothetical protein